MDDAFERAVDHERRERRERRHRRARAGFRTHAIVYGAVNALLVVIWLAVWLRRPEHYPWVVFPILGWGVGLAAHYLAIRPAFSGRSATDRDGRPASAGGGEA